MDARRPDAPWRYLAADMDAGDTHPIAGGTAAVLTARSPDKETVNEDSVALIPCGPEAGVLVVADGLGGMRAGEQASALAVGALVSAVGRAAAGELSLRDAILDGIESANRGVMELGLGAGTTLAVVQIQDGAARSYHVGDSMILVSGQRGRIKQRTVSHSPVGYAEEAGFLDAEEAMHHEARHLISNMIGTPEMRIEIGHTLPLAARDTLLVASDGLFDNLHVEEIVERVRTGPLERAATALAADCRARMAGADPAHPSKPDDLSFILFRLNRRKRMKS